MPFINNVLFFVILIFLSLSSYAQKTDYEKHPKRIIAKVKAAEDALLNNKPKRAETLYLEILEIKTDYLVALRGLSIVYQIQGKFEASAESLEKIIEKNPQFSRIVYAEAAMAFFRAGNYGKAENYFNQFAEIIKLPLTAFGVNGEKEFKLEATYARQLARNLQACELAKEAPFSKYLSRIINLGLPLNSSGDEYFPFLVQDGTHLYFTRKGKIHLDENLYLSKKKDALWSSPTMLDSIINTFTNEGMATFTRDGRKLYFTACQRRNVHGNCDIQSAIVKDQKIISTQTISGSLNSNRWESQACISCDGGSIFFASNRPNGFGSTDIYWSRLQSDNSWSEPENLGPTINTEMDEEAPFITDDGQTLFFSSTGHLGLGEQDIFMSHLQEDGTWGVAINLGAPINTGYRELGFFLAGDGLSGYFSSDRPGGQGKLDIYQFDLKKALPNESLIFVEGFVKDSVTNFPVQSVLHRINDSLIPTDPDGRFFRCLKSKDKFDFTISTKGYQPYHYSELVPDLRNKKNYRLDILLQPTKEVSIEINKIENSSKLTHASLSVFFEFGEFSLRSDTQIKLQGLLQKTKGQLIQSISIIGFADPTGSSENNQILSEKRAHSVVEFLEQNEILNVRDTSLCIMVEGKGEMLNSLPDKEKRKVEITWTFLKD